jgi:hypothetical protein
MATLTLAGVDIETTLGAHITNLGAYLDGLMGVQGEVEIPGMPGVLAAGPTRTAVREFDIEGYLDGASQAAVRANFAKLKALVSEEHSVVIGDADAYTIQAVCTNVPALNYPVGSRANSLNEFPVAFRLAYRARSPFWQSTSDTTVNFTTSATACAQGTAPSYPVLTTDTTAAGADTLIGKDYLGNTLWTAVLASRSTGERYRITTTPSVMTLEFYNGSAWVAGDSKLTSGVFPQVLPSSGIGYQTSAWPTLQSSTGSWAAVYRKQWR